MAIIAGARSFEEVVATVKAGFFSVIRVSAVLCLLSADMILTLFTDFLGGISHFLVDRPKVHPDRGMHILLHIQHPNLQFL